MTPKGSGKNQTWNLKQTNKDTEREKTAHFKVLVNSKCSVVLFIKYHLWMQYLMYVKATANFSTSVFTYC